MNRIIIITFWLLAFEQVLLAQGFKVKELKSNNSDLSASTQSRIDKNGHPCGLVKIQSKIQGLEFDGDIIGDVTYNLNEYWLYLAKGAKEFVITRPNYLPYTILLTDYGIDAIAAKNTYLLVLKDDQLNEEKCGVILHVKPYEAVVNIDGVKLKTAVDGSYRLSLPKGEHFCNISLVGYKADTRSIFTGKGMQDVDVQLESIMAEVNVSSHSGTAEILIDSISRGLGSWNGKLMPGKHTISLRQEGCVPVEHTISLSQKEKRAFNFPKLQYITGSLSFSSTPEGCTVYIDGEDYGKTPCTVDDVVYGQHLIRVELDSCGLKREKEIEVSISDNTNQQVRCELVSPEKMTCYSKSYELFRKGYKVELRGNEGEYPTAEGRFYFDSIMANIDYLDADFFRQSMFFPEYVSADGINYASVCIGDYLKWHYTSEGEYIPVILEPEKAKLIAQIMKDDTSWIARDYSRMESYKNEIKEFLRTCNTRVINRDFIDELSDIISKCISVSDEKQVETLYKRYKQVILSDLPCRDLERAVICEWGKDYTEALFWARKAIEEVYENEYDLEYDENKYIERSLRLYARRDYVKKLESKVR